jgi:hypothetical protein
MATPIRRAAPAAVPPDIHQRDVRAWSALRETAIIRSVSLRPTRSASLAKHRRASVQWLSWSCPRWCLATPSGSPRRPRAASRAEQITDALGTDAGTAHRGSDVPARSRSGTAG